MVGLHQTVPTGCMCEGNNSLVRCITVTVTTICCHSGNRELLLHKQFTHNALWQSNCKERERNPSSAPWRASHNHASDASRPLEPPEVKGISIKTPLRGAYAAFLNEVDSLDDIFLFLRGRVRRSSSESIVTAEYDGWKVTLQTHLMCLICLVQ